MSGRGRKRRGGYTFVINTAFRNMYCGDLRDCREGNGGIVASLTRSEREVKTRPYEDGVLGIVAS